MGLVSTSSLPSVEPYKLPETFTSEQLAIIHSDSRLVVGQALAGTGKSTTGLGYAAAHPNERILVLCFNTANATEAKYKYPSVCSNAKVKTVHSLAFDELDHSLRHRVTNRWNSLVVRSDLSHFGIRPDWRTTALAISLLRDFFNTSDERINVNLHGQEAINRYSARDKELEAAGLLANRLWAAMQSDQTISGMHSNVNPIKIPHDAYLKMFSLKSKRLDFDTIIFDEAQDANPVMLRILHQQYEAGAKLLFLGDAHQSIYDFRGAINGMLPENMPAEATILPLTQSWRMGARTASIANLLLKDLKGDTLRINAKGKDAPFDVDAPRTLLARLNATLIARAVAVNGEGVCWIGGIGGYRIDMLLDAWSLKEGNLHNIQDLYIKENFSHYSQLVEAADYDHEMSIIKALVEQYDDQIPQIVSDLYANAVDNQRDATLILSTIHKSKGLEWDYVEIADDFRETLTQTEDWLQGKHEDYPEQEVNLLYVASTRAKLALKINKDLYKWLRNLDEYRLQRVRSWGDAYLMSGSKDKGAPSSSPQSKPSKPADRFFANLTRFSPL